ncbi:NAD-binding protein [Moorellaceae bacterium AZ2]
MIIQGDGSDISLLKEEDIGRADIFAALTGDDKINLLVSLLAKHLGARKIITKLKSAVPIMPVLWRK